MGDTTVVQKLSHIFLLIFERSILYSSSDSKKNTDGFSTICKIPDILSDDSNDIF